ncbi:MAG: hypothetical protein J5449_05615 [Oscillospiraceae bacterium]|nr:hypothetical protein [Oscillospiraceae bacterium]
MKFYQKLDGGVHISAREYDVAYNTAITEGQLVKLSGGKVVSAAAAETGAVLGVAAENHSGVADALDPRANGVRLLVIDDPDAVFQCSVPQVTASSGSSTTLVFTAGQYFAADDFNGGYVKLVSKASGSTNTDEIGTVREITDYAVTASTSGTFTLPSGGTPNEGDVYAVFPPVGFAKGNLNTARDGVVLSASANLPLRVIGFDLAFDKINLMAKKHVFAVDA